MSNQPSGGKARSAPTEWLAGLAAAVQDDDPLSPQERAGVLLALRQGDGLGSAVSFGSITFHLVDGQVVRTTVLRKNVALCRGTATDGAPPIPAPEGG